MRLDRLRGLAVSLVFAAVQACQEPSAPAVVSPRGDASRLVSYKLSYFSVVEDLGTLGGAFSSANDLNNSNQVVGYSMTASAGLRGFLWTAPGPMVDPVSPSSSLHLAWANGINDVGQITGTGQGLGIVSPPVLMSPPYPSTPLDLGNLGLVDHGGSAVNASGQVVGYSEVPPFHPFLWTSPGPMRDLGNLSSNGSGFAADINDAGEIVGTSSLGPLVSDPSHAFYWTSLGGMVDLGTLGGNNSGARGLNERGKAVGYAEVASGVKHAVWWNLATRVATDLGTLPGGDSSSAASINESDIIAGYARNSLGRTRAMIWYPGGTTRQLPPLPGGSSSWGSAINDAGHVAGRSDFDASGNTHAVVWWNYLYIKAYLLYPFIPIVVPWEKVPKVIPVNVYGTKEMEVKRLAARLFTLGDGDGGEAAVASVDGRPMIEYGDFNKDGITDMQLMFESAALIANKDLTPETKQLVLLGATVDRKQGVYGIVEVRATP